MDKETIKKLNQLNKNFYQQTAEYFSQTRQSPWQGWHELAPLIERIEDQKKDFKVLDLGCGNGRFGIFLKNHLNSNQFYYLGVDTSRELLEIADRQLGQENIDYKLEKIDLIDSLLTEQPKFKQKFDLIVGFGLVHHIPSYDLRQKLFKLIFKNLTDIGLGVVTLWQFGLKPRFMKKKVNPNKVGLKPKDLQDNDYILDWQKGVEAYRYCHFVDQQEQEKLVSNSQLDLVDQYSADGKTNDLNKYLILKK